jgi:hypothetical protein
MSRTSGRSSVEPDDVDEWLNASVEQVASLIRVPSLEVIAAGLA